MRDDKPFKKKLKVDEPAPTASYPMRLNKFIAKSGICSRRDADELIKDGKIEVNGNKVLEMGFQVNRNDKVKCKGKPITPQDFVYVLLNKPRGFITTMEDTHDRKTVMNLVEKACTERIYPVGRLDRNTTGLLLFTNDGELTEKMTHPSHKNKKIYQVELDKSITKVDLDRIQEGITLEDGKVYIDDLAVLSKDNKILGIEIHVGKNRIVRRIFEHLGYEVTKLDRTMYGPLTKKDLPRGKWRHLSEKEKIVVRNLS